MTSPQSAETASSLLPHVGECAKTVFETIRTEVDAYRDIDRQDVLDEVRRVVTLNVKTYFAVLVRGRGVTADETAVVGSVTRMRANQAIPLDALMESYRVGTRAMWEFVLNLSPPEEHGRLALLTIQYTDEVTDAAVRAYVEERGRSDRIRRDAARILLTQVTLGDGGATRRHVEAAEALGLDFALPHTVLVVTERSADTARRSHGTKSISAINEELARRCPWAYTVFLSSGLLVVTPETKLPATESALAAAAMGDASSRHSYAIGVGRTHVGLGRLSNGYREAVRALELSRLIRSSALIHRYAELDVIDLFRDGPAPAAYIQSTLGPLMSQPERQRAKALQTLEALFSQALSRKQAARTLNIHQNTLAMRLTKLEDLLNGRFDSGEFCFRVQLALRLMPLIPDRPLGHLENEGPAPS